MKTNKTEHKDYGKWGVEITVEIKTLLHIDLYDACCFFVVQHPLKGAY